MSETEKVIFDDMLPNRQMWYLVAAKKAEIKKDELYPNTITQPCNYHNGIGDAFRHCYWNALSAKLIGVSLTSQLTTAHEEVNFTYPYQIKEKIMDLHNNNIGINLASFNSYNSILNAVQSQVTNGGLNYLSDLNSSCLPTFSSTQIPTN